MSLRNCTYFFTSSTKRVSCLQESIIGAAVDNPLQLRNLSKTRWVVRAESIKAVWSTYKAILESLAILQECSKDIKTKTAASGLLTKITRFDFIMCIMFIKNIMYKTKRMTEILQKEDLNIIDAITIMESTIKSLENVNNDIDAVNAEIQAAVIFAEHLSVDAQTDFQCRHRHRKPPARIDENPSNAVSLNLESFYWKEFKAVLDTQISTYKEVNNYSKETTRPLIDTLHPGKEVAPLESFKDQESEALMFGMEVFRSHLTDHYHTNVQDISDAAKIAEKQKSVFPLVNKAYRLALIAPVTVAKDERTFSKLKLVKTLCRSTMNDKRLVELIMACEKDITDEISVVKMATAWAALKPTESRHP